MQSETSFASVVRSKGRGNTVGRGPRTDMMANMAEGPSWTSAMAGRDESKATPHAPTMPLNMMNPVPAASAPRRKGHTSLDTPRNHAR